MQGDAHDACNHALARLTDADQVDHEIGLKDDQQLEVAIVKRHEGLDQIAQHFVIDDQVAELAPAPGEQVENEADGQERNDEYFDVGHGELNELLIQKLVLLSRLESLLPVGLAETAETDATEHHDGVRDQSLGLQPALHLGHLVPVAAVRAGEDLPQQSFIQGKA